MDGQYAALITVQEAATLLRCSPKTLYRAHARGALRGYRLSPDRRASIRLDVADLRGWLDANENARVELTRFR